MGYKDLFPSWNRGHADIRIIGGLMSPESVSDTKSVQFYDHCAAELIQRMERLSEQLKDYRTAMAARYAELASMPYRMQLELKRHKQYQGPVTYWLRLNRVYEDGHTEVEQETRYPGTERHKALKAFEAMKKQRPGIDVIKDIEKGRFER